jgi:hypothetical protein
MTDALTDTDASGALPPDELERIEPVEPPLPPLPPPAPPAPPAKAFGLTLEGWASLLIVGSCVGFVFTQLGPGNLFSDTTPAGGDMGAHVWGPAFLRDHLLPSGRLTGWTQDWYSGFPAYHFYMVLPSLAIALLSYLIPYGVAFKLVAVSGLVTLPVCAWAYGRLTRLPFPVPPLLAVAATLFLFDRSFSIYGGNIASTLAGEFAFSISLSFAVLYLGVLGRGLENGKHRVAAAVLLALTALCHLIPLIFAVAGTVIWFVLTLGWGRLKPKLAVGLTASAGAVALLLVSFTDLLADEFGSDFGYYGVRFALFWAVVAVVLLVPAVMIADFPKARLIYLVTVTPIAGFISAFWTVPFYLQRRYMNDMGWEKKENFGNYLFTRENLDPQLVDAPAIKWVLALAAVGALMAIVYGVVDRQRGAMFWVAMAVVAAVAFVLQPQGRLWNARLLPFYYLSLYCLAAIGVAYVARTFALLTAPDPDRPRAGITTAVAGAATAFALLVLALPLHALPAKLGPFQLEQERTDGSYKWGFLPAVRDNSFIDSWAKWNFTGYEGKAAYPEYHGIVQTMAAVGEERGCGRAMWEHEEQHDRYGTPMALMLLPFWTDGCIGSQEGLYFEASGTTPYHFINQDELSSAPSNAQRDLPYGPGPPSRTDFDRGIEHLQMMGVRYYMAISDRTIDYARRNDDLTEIATSGPWVVFEVADSELVTSLVNEPAVVRGIESSHETWLESSMRWYIDPSQWPVLLAADGPGEWQRIDRDESPEERAVTPVNVSNIETSQDGIEFDVDQIGTPVLVKASYFPNWKVDGAQGPYRVSPNLMVVVPTDTHVTLSYGWTAIDLLGWGLTALGLLGLVWLWRAGPVAMPETHREPEPDPDPDPDLDPDLDPDPDLDLEPELGPAP